MRIFISFASEDRDTAEEVAIKLSNGKKHNVFYDREGLPPAQEYDLRIERAVKEAELFIFLISEFSIKQRSYARTELKYAQEKWFHPGWHLLPVMLDSTPRRTLPPYLRSVSILDPEGPVAPEVISFVNKLHRKKALRTALGVGAVSAIAVTLLAAVVLQSMPDHPGVACSIVDADVRPLPLTFEMSRDAATSLKAKMPQVVDEWTTAIDVIATPDLTFEYKYELSDALVEQVDREVFENQMWASQCTLECNGINRRILASGRKVVRTYYRENGDEYLRISFDQDACNRITQ